MSDDPETARQIAELAADTRPLLVLDVDDVLLEFLRVFPNFLDQQGFELKLRTFKLTGNIIDKVTREEAPVAKVREMIDDFFGNQADWQPLTEGAADALASFGDAAEIVLLTAMPHKHRDARRLHLDALGLPYPLLTTEAPKGPAVRRLRGQTDRAVAFVDDIPHNLVSVRRAVPDAHVFHMMGDDEVRALLDPLEEGMHHVASWADAAPRIAEALGIPRGN
ncbi:hypothetical protein [Tianweitania sediminis]|uniref:HAD family hydrolase n=1 Tax=Tianweitania sediminis TaxID=1502156 RepID=A0A8J7RPG1_9HYPH|nr:hypothetical protein [Tianweitania sediminis]MBP0440781.1 hypothetical protein [Tianweitania sediminis]